MPPSLDPATEDAHTILRLFIGWLIITVIGCLILTGCQQPAPTPAYPTEHVPEGPLWDRAGGFLNPF